MSNAWSESACCKRQRISISSLTDIAHLYRYHSSGAPDTTYLELSDKTISTYARDISNKRHRVYYIQRQMCTSHRSKAEQAPLSYSWSSSLIEGRFSIQGEMAIIRMGLPKDLVRLERQRCPPTGLHSALNHRCRLYTSIGLLVWTYPSNWITVAVKSDSAYRTKMWSGWKAWISWDALHDIICFIYCNYDAIVMHYAAARSKGTDSSDKKRQDVCRLIPCSNLLKSPNAQISKR